MIAPILLVAALALQPLPGGTKGIAQASSQSQEKGKGQQQPPAQTVAPTPNQTKASNASPETAQIAARDQQQATEQTVSVRSIPPVDTRRDWIDYTQIVFTFVLIAVAIWQITLLRETLTATTTAAQAARDNATAASANDTRGVGLGLIDHSSHSHRILVCSGWWSARGRLGTLHEPPPATPTRFQPTARRLAPPSSSSV